MRVVTRAVPIGFRADAPHTGCWWLLNIRENHHIAPGRPPPGVVRTAARVVRIRAHPVSSKAGSVPSCAVRAAAYSRDMRNESLSDRDLEMLLAEPPRTSRALRAQLAISLLAEAGLAAERVCRLAISDCRPDGRIRGAEDDLPDRTRALLERALDTLERRYLLSAMNDSPLAPVALRRVVQRFADNCGVAGVTPERLRRTFARRRWEAGDMEDSLAAALGLGSRKALRALLARDPLWRAGNTRRSPRAEPLLEQTIAPRKHYAVS